VSRGAAHSITPRSSQDPFVFSWARESERFAQGGMAVPLRAFELELPDRDPERIRTLKALYTSLGLTRCLYTDSALGHAWDLDRLLPWSRFPVNLFWNLVPASPRANRGRGGKSDGLPELNRNLRQRYIGFLERCLSAGGEPIRHDVSATYRRYFQQAAPPPESPQRIAEEIFSVVENSHGRLLAAGAELWTPA
jgi:hypothetical protein